MKYAIIEVTNGNYNIHTEHGDLVSAKVEFHNRCRLLWNDPGTTTACVIIVDTNLNAVEGYREFISKAQPEPSEV